MLVKLNDCDFCEHKVPTQLAQWHLEKKHPHRLEKVTSDDLTNDEVSPIRPDFEETHHFLDTNSDFLIGVLL